MGPVLNRPIAASTDSTVDENESVFCNFFVITKKLSSDLGILQNIVNAKPGRELVMENQEMVMEKSYKNILSSL